MSRIEKDIEKRLLQLSEPGYRDFIAKLLPTVPPESILGVRMPEIRKLSKSISADPDIKIFLSSLPHRYYEENCLHACLINDMKDLGETFSALDAFLSHVDNWAVCDCLSPRAFKKHPQELWDAIPAYLSSEKTYTIRFGIEMLMSFFLDGDFRPECLERVALVRSEEYYVRMMQAWFFATALAKQYDSALPFIEGRRLEKWTHNKAIQKSIESYRITDAQKKYLRTLKVK